MAESELTIYKRDQRRLNRSKVRQALLVNDYVFYKHFDIYQEAAQLYNQINQTYPRKPDLRRTEEFRIWRNGVTGRPIRAKRKPTTNRQHYVFPPHPNIPVAEGINPNVSFTVVVEQPENPHIRPESPQPESPQPESLQSESPQPESQQPESPQPESQQPESPQPESQQPESPQPESLQPESPVQRIKKGKVMELRIPLLNPAVETHSIVTGEVLQKDNPEPTLYTETLQTVTEEVLQEGTLQPSLH